MKKIVMLMATIVVAAALAGCSIKAFDADEDTVYVQKKGTIIGAIIESFDKEYYNDEELKEMIDSEIAEYNGSTGRKSLEIESFEVVNKVAKLFINYETPDDYAAFNKVEFFAGTVKEAVDAGYGFDDKFIKADDKDASVSVKKDILQQDEYMVVILDESINVQIDGEILYLSDNAELLGKKLAKVTEDTSEAAYIIYQK